MLLVQFGQLPPLLTEISLHFPPLLSSHARIPAGSITVKSVHASCASHEIEQSPVEPDVGHSIQVLPLHEDLPLQTISNSVASDA